MWGSRVWAIAAAIVVAACGGEGGMPPSGVDSGPRPDVPIGCAGDEECDDGVFCNGPEQCLERRCEMGAAPDCDDGDACTLDRCSEETRACVHAPPDAD